MNNPLALSLIKNSFLLPDLEKPTQNKSLSRNYDLMNNNGGSKDPKKNLSDYQLPVPPARTVLDIDDWRDAVIELEKSILPYRVLIQQIFRDTVLNPHVDSCLEKRKELTLLRNFQFCYADGKPNNELTKLLNKSWFKDFLSYSLDSKFYGYSLISLGDFYNYDFPELTIIRRDLISPERKHVTTIPYNPAGYSWEDPEYAPYHIWVSTKPEHGTASCGMGLLYSVALREINLRNLYAMNMDFLEVFGSPYRALFMENAIDPIERARGINSLSNQGGANFGIFGKDDKLEFVGPGGGSGWKAYADAESRWNKDISKVILGHSDVLDSTPGKLGSTGGGGKNGEDHNPQKDALVAKQASDASFLIPIVNGILLPKLRDEFFFDIPEGTYFKFLNSEEDAMIENRQLELNLKMSEISKNLIGTGYEIDQEYFENVTGIKLAKTNIKENI